MKKIFKASIVLLMIISSFIGMQNVQGVFQFDVGDKVAYEIVRAGRDLKVSTTAERFIGCNNSGTILNNGTVIVVQVNQVDTSSLDWNTTNLSPTIIGSCTSYISEYAYREFLVEVGYFLGDFDLEEIISTGIIAPVYFDPIELPLFVDPKPDTWIIFNNILPFISGGVSSDMFTGWWDVHTNELDISDTNNIFTFSLDFTASTAGDPRPEYHMAIESSAFASYNMISGALIEASINHTLWGLEDNVAFEAYSDYKIQQTDLPSDGFNFLEFLKENKWYFIGAASGVGVIALTVGITVGVMKTSAKRKGATNPSTKKPSKKKSAKKKK